MAECLSFRASWSCPTRAAVVLWGDSRQQGWGNATPPAASPAALVAAALPPPPTAHHDLTLGQVTRLRLDHP